MIEAEILQEKFRRLSHSVVKVRSLRIGILVFSFVCAGFYGLSLHPTWIPESKQPWMVPAFFAVLTLLGFVAFVVVAPLWRYRVHRWEISPAPGPPAVYTRSGWITQERRIAPISRVQTVDTFRGPLDRLFGLANVTVTTASSAGAVHIAALDSEVADRVVAQLTDLAAIGAEDAT